MLIVVREIVLFMLFLSQILEHQNTHKNRDFDSLVAECE